MQSLEKRLLSVEKELNSFMIAIGKGVITKLTTSRVLELESQKEELEEALRREKTKLIKPLNEQDIVAFLNYFANKEYSENEEKNEFINKLFVSTS